MHRSIRTPLIRTGLVRPALTLAALAASAALSACAGTDHEGTEAAAGGTASGGATSSSPPPVRTTPTPLPPVVPVTTGPSPTRDPASVPGPYVASATWADSALGSTLEVAPTPAGRATAGERDAVEAWREVLALAPDADTPGMWEQFACHWTWARVLEPDKPTWNVEPWRPVVDEGTMIAERCNPGGPEV